MVLSKYERRPARVAMAALALVLCAGLAQAGLITQDDLGHDLDIVDFGSFTPGTLPDDPLRHLGMAVGVQGPGALSVTDPLDEADRSLRVGEPGSYLRVDLGIPRRQVGIVVGDTGEATSITLAALGAKGEMIEVVVAPLKSVLGSPGNFVGIGLATPAIHGVMVGIDDPSVALTVDDLVMEPSQVRLAAAAVAAAGATLSGSSSSLDDKLEAVSTLMRHPSSEGLQILHDVVTSGGDAYVRERSMIALVQLGDTTSIPLLAAVGVSETARDLRLAAHNSVWALRQLHPKTDPPVVTLVSFGPFVPGEPFEVEAQIVSPILRDNVKMQFAGGGALDLMPGRSPLVDGGTLQSDSTTLMRASYVAQQEGVYRVPFRIQASDDPIDAYHHTHFLHVRVGADGGEASTTPFADPAADVELTLDLGDTQ